MAEGTRDLCGVPFIRALVPFVRVPPSWPNGLSEAPLPNTITGDVRISTREFGGECVEAQTFSP